MRKFIVTVYKIYYTGIFIVSNKIKTYILTHLRANLSVKVRVKSIALSDSVTNSVHFVV